MNHRQRVKYWRNFDIDRLKEIRNNITEASEEPRKIMNSFYRYSAFREHVVELENDERLCNQDWVQKRSDRAFAWQDRLDNYLRPYGLKIFIPWIHPVIVFAENNCTFTEGYYYD